MFGSLQYGQSGIFLDDRCCLMARMEGADAGTDLTENSGLHRAYALSGATTSTTQVKTGTSSGSFYVGTVSSPTNGSWLTYKENLECVLRDDFTIQYWLWIKSRAPSTGNVTRVFLSLGDGCIYVANTMHFEDGRIRDEAPNGRFFFHGTDQNGLYTPTLPSINTWHHIAHCRYRSASTGKITMEGWIDGVSIGTKNSSSAGIDVVRILGSAEEDAYVGPYTTVGATTNISDVKSQSSNCYIDELQILNGTALYRDGVTFTPPAYEL